MPNFNEQTSRLMRAKTIGLVICGGQSTRMGVDKSKIIYHGREQRYHVYKMLQQCCADTYLSCNMAQVDTVSKDYNFIADAKEYADIGPMAALLTAMDKFSDADFLVLGCDYPLLDMNELNSFVGKLKGINTAAAFYNSIDNVYEPLLAYYPKNATNLLKDMFRKGNYSLQQFLKQTSAMKHIPLDDTKTISVDTPTDRALIESKLK